VLVEACEVSAELSNSSVEGLCVCCRGGIGSGAVFCRGKPVLLWDGCEDRVPGELGGNDPEPDALQRRELDLVRRHREEHVAVDECVERLDRPRHRGMYLPAERAQQPRVQFLVRDHDGQRCVPGRRVHGDAGCDPLLDARHERTTQAGRRIEVASHDRTVATDDRADRVHDREDRDPRLADPPEGGALPGRLEPVEAERLADGRRSSRAAHPEREHTRARRP
jgi:hypothetical protein